MTNKNDTLPVRLQSPAANDTSSCFFGGNLHCFFLFQQDSTLNEGTIIDVFWNDQKAEWDSVNINSIFEKNLGSPIPKVAPQQLMVVPYRDQVLQIFYVSTNKDLVELRFRKGKWKLFNISKQNETLQVEISTSFLASFGSWINSQNIIFSGIDSNLHRIYYETTWKHQIILHNIKAQNLIALSSGHVFFTLKDEDEKSIYCLHWNDESKTWSRANITEISGCPIAQDEPFAAYLADQIPHVFFRDLQSNIYEITFEESEWRFTNVTLISHNPKPEGKLSAFCVFYAHVNSFSHHILYQSHGDIIEICQGPNKPPPVWKFYNLSQKCKVPKPLQGDPVPLSSNNQVIANLCAFYIRTSDNHIHQFKWDLPKLEWNYFDISASVKNFTSTLEGKLVEASPAPGRKYKHISDLKLENPCELIESILYHLVRSYEEVLQTKYMMAQSFQNEAEVSSFFKEVSNNIRFKEVDKIISLLSKISIPHSKNEKLAFFLNAHNALTLHSVVIHGFPFSAMQRYTHAKDAVYEIAGFSFFFHLKFQGHKISILEIEHAVLRAHSEPTSGFLGSILYPKFKKDDSRIEMIIEKPDPCFNFAINWLSKSSPMIRIYHPDQIDLQLHHAARVYLEKNLIMNSRSKQVALPKIMDWFDKDFGSNQEELITWIMKILGDSSLTAMDPITSEYSIGFDKFDWDFHFSFVWI